MKWHVGHGRELSEKESDQRCLLIGVKQVICLGRGRPLIGFINRLSHQQIKYFNKNYTLPAKCRLDIHALLGKRVSFHLNTCLNSEAKGAVSLEGEWMTVRFYTMELCSMNLLPHLHSCSPWCKWKWNSNNSEHFLDVRWEAQCYIYCILSMALTLLTLRADEPLGWSTTGFSVTFFLFLTILCLSSHMKNIYYQLLFNGILPKDLWLYSDFIDFSRGKDHVVHCAFWTVDTCSPSYILESSFIIWIFFFSL